MDLVERYLQEVGHFIPFPQRADILAELRSLLDDTLEDRAGATPTDADVAAVLQEFGPPRQVAAAYYPAGQYLIGPALFSLFRLVASIAVAAVVGAQLLAYAIAFIFGEGIPDPLAFLAQLFNSVLFALGAVVIVFAILQRFDVNPGDEAWNPLELPPLADGERVSRLERMLEIVFSTAFIAILVLVPNYVDLSALPGGAFFTEPALGRLVSWLILSIVLSIGVDIYLAWQGRWQLGTRLASLAVNLVSLVVIGLIFQAHTDWLAAAGQAGFADALQALSNLTVDALPWVVVHGVRLGFGVAFVVTALESIGLLYRLLRSVRPSSQLPGKIAPGTG